VRGNGRKRRSFASLWKSCAAVPPHLTFYKMNLPLPDILTPNIEDPALRSAFMAKFRVPNPTIPSNIPTACTLRGTIFDSLAQLPSSISEQEIFVFTDSSESLRKEAFNKVEEFWIQREPWEDYDFCVFPRSLEWCIGFTHNDSIILS